MRLELDGENRANVDISFLFLLPCFAFLGHYTLGSSLISRTFRWSIRAGESLNAWLECQYLVVFTQQREALNLIYYGM